MGSLNWLIFENRAKEEEGVKDKDDIFGCWKQEWLRIGEEAAAEVPLSRVGVDNN